MVGGGQGRELPDTRARVAVYSGNYVYVLVITANLLTSWLQKRDMRRIGQFRVEERNLETVARSTVA